MASSSIAISNNKTIWQRMLEPFASVRPGEGAMAVLLSVQVAILMASYYLLKAAREALVLTEGGAEVKSYAAAAQALMLLALVPAYGWLSSRVNPVRFIRLVSAFSIASLIAFYFAGRAGWHVGVPFFLWLGVFNILAVTQFWAFATDLYNEEQGYRLFPLLGVGSALGGFAGAQLASGLFRILGPFSLMLVAAGLLGISMLVVTAAHFRARKYGAAVDHRAFRPLPPAGEGNGFKMVFSSRYLSLIALMVVLLNIVNTTGEFLMSKLALENAERIASTAAARQQYLGAFYANFYSWQTLVSSLAQVFLVSRFLRWFGVGGSLFVLPLIALGGYAGVTALPLLGVIQLTKGLENATDYTISNTARHALLLPSAREVKYKAKAAIETFFYRMGDVGQAIIVAAGSYFAFSAADFALVNVVIAIIWIGVVVQIGREHRSILRARNPKANAMVRRCCKEPAPIVEMPEIATPKSRAAASC